MSIVMEGYLHKQGSFTSKNWHTRYFILQNNLLLRFDEKPASSRHPGEAKESINLTGCTILRNSFASKGYAFSINGPLGREICVLAAQDMESYNNWFNTLTAATAKKPTPAPNQTVIVVQAPNAPVRASSNTTIVYQQPHPSQPTHSLSTSHLPTQSSWSQYPGNTQPPPPQTYSQPPPQSYSNPPPQTYSQPPPQSYSQPPPSQSLQYGTYSQFAQPYPPPSQQPPPQHSSYPPPQSSYPPPQSSYPPPQSSYPPPQSSYNPPPPQSSYPPSYSQAPPQSYPQPPTSAQPPSAPPSYYNEPPRTPSAYPHLSGL
eukprot:Phypoly_transcript_12878.p1 GENE.Phypoly_transcript_12878~~Phypoly_transcript_12878.p1  ORF type:complete len:315 (-),score=91.37 Phypoly_transcript_12878:88-1032(-)